MGQGIEASEKNGRVPKLGGEVSGRLTLVDNATLVGLHCWLALKSFEILGNWAMSEANASAKVHFHAFSLYHFKLADYLKSWVPDVPQLGGRSSFVPPVGEFSAALSSATQGLGRLAETGPRISARYGEFIPWYQRLLGCYPEPLDLTSRIAVLLDGETRSAYSEIDSYQDFYDSGAVGPSFPEMHIDSTGKM